MRHYKSLSIFRNIPETVLKWYVSHHVTVLIHGDMGLQRLSNAESDKFENGRLPATGWMELTK